MRVLQPSLLFSLVLFTVVHPRLVAARTWTHVSGQHHVEADFVTEKYGGIWLLGSIGGVFRVEPNDLSPADRQYVQQVMQQRNAAGRPTTENPPGRVAYGVGRELGFLENRSIRESSGLARSQRTPGFFWTHNDSGGDARVFLIDKRGRDHGSVILKDTLAYDAEDIFSYSENGRHFLVLCDVGNNVRAAPIQMLHLFEEPKFDLKQEPIAEREVTPTTIYYSYEDDHRDCEAVGFDATTKTLLFATKERDAPCEVYALPMPTPNPTRAFSARRIATLDLPAVTGLDISSDGLRAALITYGDGYEFQRTRSESWSETFARKPRRIVLPERVQGESICYGADDRTLYLTSEKRPTPLLVVPVCEAVTETP